MSAAKTKMLQVSAIEAGTVIDHIDSDHTFAVASILKLHEMSENVLIAVNLDTSHGRGKKGLIKVGNRFLTQEEVNRIAAISPRATVNIIEGYKVVKKFQVRIPDVIEGTFRCFNPNCVSNHESVANRFYLVGRDPLRVRCHYCERQMASRDLQSV